MTAISSTRHYQFLDELKKRVFTLNKDQQDGLKAEVAQMHRMYEEYQNK